MIQDDLQVGHDIYCTRWEDLQYDANYEHPNISKLQIPVERYTYSEINGIVIPI
mgnify:FL=1